ncbi:MAG TPA: nuclear transport factor 2 family protein [Saprospiraceae bacterium]|nr:nuclear transport factor 2 family protein [Saprospiraceae bacterium]
MKNQLVWAFSLFVLFMVACKPAATTDEAAAGTKADTTAANAPKAPAEFADPKYSEIVKTGMDALSKGDIPAYMSQFSDNAVYNWNTGDSLAGKKAITDYWVKRRGEVIDSITFSNQIFLPLMVNTPQANEKPGTWVLAWYQVDAKYKTTGKKMTQWMHSVAHFDSSSKIDQMILYSDRSLINAALTK